MSETFDTLAAARKLEAAGMDRKLAEAVAGVIRDGLAEFATRDDLAALRSDIAALKWMAGANLALTLVTFAAVLAMVFQS